MNAKPLKLTSRELRRLFNHRNVLSLHQLSRKALLNQMESYKKADLIKLANQRNLNVNKKLATSKLKQLIITDINKEISQKELLNKYSDKIDKIRKSYDYISNHLVSLHKSKLSDQLISSFKNRSRNIKKYINNLEKSLQNKLNNTFNKQLSRKIQSKIDQIRTNIKPLNYNLKLKNKRNEITNALVLLKQYQLATKVYQGSISNNQVNIVKNLLKLPLKHIKKVAELRNNNPNYLDKQDLIIRLLRY